jgi:hypothetical protein
MAFRCPGDLTAGFDRKTARFGRKNRRFRAESDARMRHMWRIGGRSSSKAMGDKFQGLAIFGDNSPDIFRHSLGSIGFDLERQLYIGAH